MARNEFWVLGFHSDKNELVFEQLVSLSVEDLKPVMQWVFNDDHIGVDFRLSMKQVLEIERLASLVFPQGLDLYLTSYD
ncbi:hypothetical protein B0E42_24465 [Pseudomonas sp. A25(2017)]|uniref:hypothetical protein n=1 Tax=Pseudomonas TaxID=286 RepID=UPI00069F2DEA|nr:MULTISPECIES: hypothetical protein [Pseudomonas]OOG81608.1 hypothetical protein B0E42_24465 [Pseudomonas sp. A25(2017)]